MAFVDKMEEQEEFDYDYFLKKINFIEENFTDEIAKKFSGKEIFVLLNGIFNETYFVKTTVSDVIDVCGDININWIENPQQYFGIDNMKICSLKKATQKTFRGRLRYTPKNTLCYDVSFIGVNEDYSRDLISYRVPVLQDEKKLISECDKAFENNEGSERYEEIEKNCYKFLHIDKRISTENISGCRQSSLDEASASIHRIICLYFELELCWGVTYVYKNILFIFPIDRKFFKSLFKNRDKENGRRRGLPTIVKAHSRKNGSCVDSHLRCSNGFSIDGREFGFVIGAEDFENIFPKTYKSEKRIKKLVENCEAIGRYYVKK